jgi:RNA polymerase sigma-70 factor (ECF subfamily)
MTGTAPTSPDRQIAPDDDDIRLVAALQQGNEQAFIAIVERFHLSLTRLALAYVQDRAIAEEIVQDTWLALVRGIARFEGRSSLKTWLFRVLMYQARARASREERSVPFSAVNGPTVDPARFLPDGHRWAGHWAEAFPSFDDTPEEFLLRQETMSHIRHLIAQLPSRQRIVLVLRDIEGVSAAEVCDILSMNDGTERVLLHRARAKVREGLEKYLRESESAS